MRREVRPGIVIITKDNLVAAHEYEGDGTLPIAAKIAYVKSQGQTRDHGCHWPGCERQVPPAKWGCYPHWMRLPAHIRNRIWQEYEPGQEVSMTPSDGYLHAVEAAQKWIEENAL